MTDISAVAASGASLLAPDAQVRRRNAAEARFRAYGLGAIVLALLALGWLLWSILSGGLPAFRQTVLDINVTLDASRLDKEGTGDRAVISKTTTTTYAKFLAEGLRATAADRGIATVGVDDKELSGLISQESAATLRRMVLADPALVGRTMGRRLLRW